MEEDKLMHVKGGDLPDKEEEIFSTDSNGGVMVIEKMFSSRSGCT